MTVLEDAEEKLIRESEKRSSVHYIHFLVTTSVVWKDVPRICTIALPA